MKIKKLIFGVVAFLFFFGIYTSIIHAEPNVPATTAPITPAQSFGQTPIQNAPVPGNIPQVSKDNPIPVNPNPPSQQGFDPTPLNVPTPVPPTPTPPEAPVKNYQTAWYTSFWFLATMVILLVFIILAIYSIREGKAPSEEKEETAVSKKKKNNKK